MALLVINLGIDSLEQALVIVILIGVVVFLLTVLVRFNLAGALFIFGVGWHVHEHFISVHRVVAHYMVGLLILCPFTVFIRVQHDVMGSLRVL